MVPSLDAEGFGLRGHGVGGKHILAQTPYAGDMAVLGRRRGLAAATVVSLVLFSGTATGLGIYEELPNRVTLEERYSHVLVQVQETQGDFEGACDAALIWANNDGATIEILDRDTPNTQNCDWENSSAEGEYTDFHFTFRVTEDIAEAGEDYQFQVQVEVKGSYDNRYTKTSNYGVTTESSGGKSEESTRERGPVLSVQRLSVGPQPVHRDQMFSVIAEVANVGDTQISTDAILRVDESPVDSKSVSIPSGGETTISFLELSFQEVGSHSVELTVGDVSAETRVSVTDSSSEAGKVAPVSVLVTLPTLVLAALLRRQS